MNYFKIVRFGNIPFKDTIKFTVLIRNHHIICLLTGDVVDSPEM